MRTLAALLGPLAAAFPVTPPAANAPHFAAHIPGAGYLELPGERGHFTPATPPDARHDELREVAGLAVRFFEDALSR